MKYLKYINELFFKHDGGYLNDAINRLYKDCEDKYDENYDDSDLVKVISILERDCGLYLKELIETKSDVLLRGSSPGDNKVENGLYLIKNKYNRKPLTMDLNISLKFDEYFSEKFGIPLRKFGIFTTKNISVSTGYGGSMKPVPLTKKIVNPDIIHPKPGHKKGYLMEYINESIYSGMKRNSFIVFPIGEYRYFWNPKVEDLYEDFFIEGEEDPIIEEIVSGYVENEGIEKVTKQEVTFVCDKFYLLDDAFIIKIDEYLKSKY